MTSERPTARREAEAAEVAAGPCDAASLASRARGGDRTAERALCIRIAPAVRAFARRRLHGRAEVDDFTHDVLLTFIEALRAGRIEAPDRAGAFALGICRNYARDRARVRDRRREALTRFFHEEDIMPAPSPMLFDRARLEDCLSRLTGRGLEVIRASYHAERRDAEIAASMNLTEVNVRVIRHRSIAALGECLEGPVSWQKR